MRQTTMRAAALAALCGLGSPVQAGECKAVEGVLEETQVGGPACTSAVSLCTVGLMAGRLRGQTRFTATSILASIDTPATGVVFVTGDTLVTDAHLGGRQGTLLIKNAAAFRTTGSFDLTDTQVIVGGTGDFAGASGSIRTTGTFANGSGSSTFEGSICLP
jgi:hypothetical protein